MSKKHRNIIFLLLSTLIVFPSCATENNFRPSNSNDLENNFIYPANDKNHTYHVVGGWGDWFANDKNKMTPISLDDASKLGLDLSDKPVEYVYKYDLTINSKDVDSTCKAVVNGHLKYLNGKYKIKVIIASYDEDEMSYNHDYYITNPADINPGNAEALTNNIFIPPYQKQPDSNGLSWADDPVITSGEGSYIFVCVKYTTESTASEVGYGFALFEN